MNVVSDAVMLTRAMRAGQGKLSGPYKLTAAVSYVCHQRCTHCRIWQREQTEELSAGDWRRVWQNASETLSWLDLTGGEVTDREDFSEIAIAAVEECPRLAMLHYPSNGRNTDQLIRCTQAIMDAQPHRLVLSISLDGPPKLHDRLRGDKGAFAAAIKSYKAIRSLGVEVYFGMTLSAWNTDQLDATYSAIVSEIPNFTWRDLHINFLHHSEHYFGNKRVKENNREQLRTVIDQFIALRGTPRKPTHVLEHLFLRRIPEHLVSGSSPVPCGSMAGQAFIAPDGTVYPCHIWDNPIANLKEHNYSLKTIWTLPKAVVVRNEVKKNQCPGCWTPCEAYPSLLNFLPKL